jgi:Ca2+-binding RTX toxin-like protein
MRSLLVVVLLAVLALLPAEAAATRIYAVTATHSVWFDSTQPGVQVGSAALSGIGAGQTVIGIDWRPATGTFVLLTRESGTARLYDFDPSTGVASSPITLTADPTDATSPYTSLSTLAGIDINPVADRLRVVTTAEENLRVNLDTGLTITDTPITPTGHVIAAVAYTNVDNDAATGTTLYDYGYSSDTLFIQNPANNGNITSVGTSGFTVTGSPSFLHMDVAQNGGAFLTGFINLDQRLARMDLATGEGTLIGPTAVDDILGMTAVNNTISIADATVSASEAAGSVDITLVRDTPAEPPSNSVNVGVTASPGSADSSDFGAVPTEIAFADGETIDKITIPITDDTTDEPTETFTVAIEGGPGVPTAAPRTVTVTVTDDDPAQVTTTVTETQTQTITVDRPVGPAPRVLLPGRCANALDGTAADDALAGTTAGDRLRGLGGADGLAGLAGDDCLEGGSGDDLLSGGAGADDLRGGSGSNLVFGGAGGDTVAVANGKRDVVDCGTGRDRVTADRRDRLRRCERVTRRR